MLKEFVQQALWSETSGENHSTPELFEVFEDLKRNRRFRNVALGFLYYNKEKAIRENDQDIVFFDKFINCFENLIRNSEQPEISYEDFKDFFDIKEITRIFYALSRRRKISTSSGSTSFGRLQRISTIEDGIDIGFKCFAELDQAFLESRHLSEEQREEMKTTLEIEIESKAAAIRHAEEFLSSLRK